MVHQLPCAAGTCSTQEAGTRSPYVQYGGPGTYVSTQVAASCKSSGVGKCAGLRKVSPTPTVLSRSARSFGYESGACT